MKFKTTQKEIKNNYYDIIRIGYCNAWYLLYYQEPIAYTSGIYGWNSDIYEVDGVAISTGYRPFGNVSSHGLIADYNAKAKEIINNNMWKDKQEETKQAVNKLLKEFIKKAVERAED